MATKTLRPLCTVCTEQGRTKDAHWRATTPGGATHYYCLSHGQHYIWRYARVEKLGA